MMKSTSIKILSGLAVILIVAGGYFLLPQLTPGDTSTRPVIVGIKIDPPYQTDGSLSPDKQAKQRQAILETTDRVLDDLRQNKYDFVNLKRFEFIPFFAIAVSENGYQYLLKHPLITSVAEDRVSAPMAPTVLP